MLPDWGFNIKESVGLYCATVKFPPFTKGRKQLSGIDIEHAGSAYYKCAYTCGENHWEHEKEVITSKYVPTY